jgi:hypothetical protein
MQCALASVSLNKQFAFARHDHEFEILLQSGCSNCENVLFSCRDAGLAGLTESYNRKSVTCNVYSYCMQYTMYIVHTKWMPTSCAHVG